MRRVFFSLSFYRLRHHVLGMSDEAPTPKPYGFFSLLWRLSLAAVIVLGLSATGGYYAVRHLVETPESQAPDLIAMPLLEAVEKASEDGFGVLVEKREVTDLLETGRILAQRPTADSWVKEGSTIRLTVAVKP